MIESEKSWGYAVELKGDRPEKQKVYLVESSDGYPGTDILWSIWDNQNSAELDAEEVGGYVIEHELNVSGLLKTWD